MKTKVCYWMTKHPLKIEMAEKTESAAHIMKKEGIRHLVVLAAKTLVGVISEKDLDLIEGIRKRFGGIGAPPITVGDVMSRNPVTVSPEDSMVNAITLMKDKNIRCLPVIDSQDRVLGILTQSDILRYALVASQSLHNEEVDLRKVL